MSIMLAEPAPLRLYYPHRHRRYLRRLLPMQTGAMSSHEEQNGGLAAAVTSMQTRGAAQQAMVPHLHAVAVVVHH